MTAYYIGIDPSTSKTGYAVLDKTGALITSGTIKAKADDPVAFQELYQNLWKLLAEYPPAALVCEQQYGGVNVATSIKLIRPTGVVLAVMGLFPEIPFSFQAPSSWRKIYHVGTGYEKRYNKKNSFEVTKTRFPGVVSSFNKDNDISDAIGIAYACWKTHREVVSVGTP